MISLSSLAVLGAVLVAAYGGVVAFFKVSENKLLYHPDRTPYAPLADDLRHAATRVDLRTSDSVSLAAWAIHPPASVPADSAPWLLYCHGNGGNIGLAGIGTTGAGIWGQSTSYIGVVGSSIGVATAVFGFSTSTGFGVHGESQSSAGVMVSKFAVT